MSEFFQGVTFANQNVTPADDAILRRRLLSDGVLTGCELTYAGYTLTMASGYLIACGRQIRRPKVENWAISDATSGYARVLMTIDLTRTATEEVFDQINTSIEYATSKAGFSALIQDDITATGSKYQLALAIVSLGAGGITGIASCLAPARAYGYNYNLTDNSDFTQFVAQAGVGGLHGTQAYAGDRWILDSGTVTGEANENGNGYRNITLNGTIRQIIANPPAVGTAGVEMISGTAAVSYENGELTITSAGGIIKNVLLCAADTLPEYRPKDYAAELAECLRYYYRLSNNEVYAVQNPGSLYNATTVRTTFTLPVEMRVNPTVSILSGSVATWGVFTIDGLVHPTAYTVLYQLKNRAVSFVLTIPSKTTQRPAVVCISSSIDFSADL